MDDSTCSVGQHYSCRVPGCTGVVPEGPPAPPPRTAYLCASHRIVELWLGWGSEAWLQVLRGESLATVQARVAFPADRQSTVNHPAHYNAHPSGIEVIEIVRHMGFNLGNVVKYILRCDEKGNAVEDLEKARWYLDDEIAKRKKAVSK